MAVIGWGKPNIFAKNLADTQSNWFKLDTPKEDSTELTPSKGDVLEATEEGGGTVDKKTKKSTYELAYQLFVKKNVKQPFKTIDGIVEGNYAVAVQPEDPSIPGVYLGKTTIGAEEAMTSADGGLITYTHSAVIPEGDENAATTDESGNTVYCQMRWRIITATAVVGKAGEYTLAFAHPTGYEEGD